MSEVSPALTSIGIRVNNSIAPNECTLKLIKPAMAKPNPAITA